MPPLMKISKRPSEVVPPQVLDACAAPSIPDQSLADGPECQTVLFIARILSDGKPHKAGKIAIKMGVTPSTISRTLRYMRDELKLPILTGRDGFSADRSQGTEIGS